jgi:Holliday junction resolvase RusA-like endonuclease
MTPLHFDAVGTPQPQGSAKAFVVGGKARITSDNTRLKPWREAVVYAAWDAMERAGWTTTEAPVEVTLSFRLPRPKSVRRTWPTVRPDLDKLTRAVLDSMTTAGVFGDDSQVIAVYASKAYANGLPGVTITVSEREHS